MRASAIVSLRKTTTPLANSTKGIEIIKYKSKEKHQEKMILNTSIS